MTLETFFENFDTFADAPNAVGKMRGLILQLAMQGNLSEPCKADSPVSSLLRDVERERASCGIKSSGRVANDASEEEACGGIPPRWTWVRFGQIARHNAGKTLDKGRNRGELRDYITTSNLYWGSFQLESVRQMPIQEDELDRCTATKGDLLIVEGGEAGRAAVWPYDYDISFQNHVHRARFFAGINAYFVQRYFEKLNATGEIDQYRKGVGISNMSGKALASIPIPLPPLAEQKRIVAKVDELMALCDRLEAQQQERDTRHAALARASLARFADAPTPKNLNFLFHKSFHIPPADLRKSILSLAVRGKLASQNPKDEPASSILLATRSLFEILVAAKKLSAPKALSPIKNDEVPFALPCGWAWCRFGQLMRISSGDGLISRDMNNGPIPVYGGNGVNGHHDAYNVSKKTLVIGRVGFYCGSIHVTPDKAWITDNAFITTFDEKSVDLEFLCWLLKATDLRARDNATAQPVISGSKVYPTILALPPLAEQRRIVAKVDQLMALVGELETQLATSRATAKNLLESLVAELTIA